MYEETEGKGMAKVLMIVTQYTYLVEYVDDWRENDAVLLLDQLQLLHLGQAGVGVQPTSLLLESEAGQMHIGPQYRRKIRVL